jgi:hypothetical protein
VIGLHDVAHNFCSGSFWGIWSSIIYTEDYTDLNIPVTSLLLRFVLRPEFGGLIFAVTSPLCSRKADKSARSMSFIRWASEQVDSSEFTVSSRDFHPQYSSSDQALHH